MGLFQQLWTAEFVFITIFATLGIFRANIFIAMNAAVLQRLTGDDASAFDLFNTVFGYSLPCGFVFIPLINFSVRRGIKFALHSCNAMGIVVFALMFAHGSVGLWLQAVNFLFFAGFRAFVY